MRHSLFAQRIWAYNKEALTSHIKESILDKVKVREVLTLYRQKFVSLGIEAEDFPHEEYLPSDFLTPSLSHCHGMIPKMEVFLEEGRLDKMFRWLGFIQATLWAARLFTLEELKNHSRSEE